MQRGERLAPVVRGRAASIRVLHADRLLDLGGRGPGAERAVHVVQAMQPSHWVLMEMASAEQFPWSHG